MTTPLSLFERFMPHGMCYAWQPGILWMHVISDAAIAIAYFSIPIALFYFLRHRTDVPFRAVVLMFSVFILACGVTHAMSIVTVWNGYYGIQGVLKTATAVASIATAVMLYPIMPKMLALRSPFELEASNNALQVEIEQRKRTELQSLELQRELAHIGRLTTMGQMATGLAHELNQPLLSISQSADTALFAAKQSAASDQELIDCIDDIQAQTQRAGEIIRALRQFLSKDTTHRRNLDLNELIKQTLQLIHPDAKKHSVEMTAELSDMPEIVADRVQIAQVLVNLLRNGVDSIVSSQCAKRQVTAKTRLESGNVLVTVEDSGPGLIDGVDPFKAFETSKSDGMGMGLSISRSIVESHGGSLWFENVSGAGARFFFTMPLKGS